MPTARETAEQYILRGLHTEHSNEARVLLLKLYDTLWQHYNNKHIYRIVGFSWSGDLDQWCVEYKRPGSRIKYNRSFTNAFANVDGIHYRFTEVAEKKD